MKWKIWTLFNNWFSVINNLKIFYKESQTRYFTNVSLIFFFFFSSVQKNGATLTSVQRASGVNSIHTHNPTNKLKKLPLWWQTSNSWLSAVLCSYIFHYFLKPHLMLNSVSPLTEYFSFFFSFLFSHICHRAPDQGLQSHIHTRLSHWSTPTPLLLKERKGWGSSPD